MIIIEELFPYAERYAEMEMRPLRITLYLRQGAQLAGYDPLCLDNLLARCVLNEALQGRGLNDTPEAYDLPVPLRCLWRNEQGWPLWAATPFLPTVEAIRDLFYQHKRVQEGRWTKGKQPYGLQTVSGRWMERRVPLPTMIADSFSATCIGNAIEIGRLLEPLSHAGKRRAIGFGEIHHWLIEPAEAWMLMTDDLRLARSLPQEAVELLGYGFMPIEEPIPVPWTPPQWKASLFLPGWLAGTQIEVDWFAVAT